VPPVHGKQVAPAQSVAQVTVQLQVVLHWSLLLQVAPPATRDSIRFSNKRSVSRLRESFFRSLFIAILL
jgi:hypothetical protein